MVKLREAVAEQPVKVTATPNGGYELSNIKVTDKDGKLIAVRSGEFVMPASDVTVLAIFESTTLDNTPQTGNGYIITITSILSGIVVIAFIGIVTKRKLKNN